MTQDLGGGGGGIRQGRRFNGNGATLQKIICYRRSVNVITSVKIFSVNKTSFYSSLLLRCVICYHSKLSA
jgi:hypothetical protein